MHQIASGRSRISKRCVNSWASATVKPQLWLWRWPLGPRVAGRPRRVMRQWRKPCLGPCTDSWGWLRMICRYHGAMPMLSTYFYVICIDVMYVCLSVRLYAYTCGYEPTPRHTRTQLLRSRRLKASLSSCRRGRRSKKVPRGALPLTKRWQISAALAILVYFGGPKHFCSVLNLQCRGGVLGFMWAVVSSLWGQCRVHIIILCLQIYVFVIIVENDAAKCFIKGIANRRTPEANGYDAV